MRKLSTLLILLFTTSLMAQLPCKTYKEQVVSYYDSVPVYGKLINLKPLMKDAPKYNVLGNKEYISVLVNSDKVGNVLYYELFFQVKKTGFDAYKPKPFIEVNWIYLSKFYSLLSTTMINEVSGDVDLSDFERLDIWVEYTK